VKTLFASAGLAVVLAAAGSASATELLTNGDFSAGPTGFTSQYVYSPPNGTGMNLWPEGTWDVTTNANLDHPLFYPFGDHTTGDGEMMVVNGASDAKTIVWSEDVHAASNSAFSFTFFIASVYPDSPADLELWINGATVPGATFQAIDGLAGVGNWQAFSYSGVSGAAGIHSISLSNLNTAASGNDFALDDLSLKGVVPEPASWSLMILGFGAVGGLIRSNRRRMIPVSA
jgi:hypothetical protein